ncbi:hypothetical protein AUP68_07172 [Ilyonectria robusta]
MVLSRAPLSSSGIPLCGCYIIVDSARKHLPQLKVNVHTTIFDTTTRTTLTQTFVNPSKDDGLDEVNYVFPLYDGVSIVGFKCTIADRIINGVVKERRNAKTLYAEAKARGETAALLEQFHHASDIFSTTIGNVPVGQTVHVEITFLGELKHDAEINGVRFTIPTHVAPRYGDAASLQGSSLMVEEGISITIDAEMPDCSSIKSINSPSHPISVSIGTTSQAPAAESSLSKASVTLSQGSASLDQDFIIHVVTTKIDEPVAFLETHPTIPNHRAIIATFVSKFNLPAEKPEIVFLCDRSGSMKGKLNDLIRALIIFLKSLPIGVKFNICSFGSRFSFLWPESKTYNQETLDEAVSYVQSFDAKYGGTRMYGPMEAIFQQRSKDMNLEVFLITDGKISSQQELFTLINKEVARSRNAVRVFTLGVGSGASSALIEGVARAGSGFAQMVTNSEQMDKKVVRMLKGALLPHISDYSLEINYEKADSQDTNGEDSEFEFVERVMDSLSIRTFEEHVQNETKPNPEKPLSLFDPNFDEKGDDIKLTDDINTEHTPLSKISVPRYLQTPSDIPPMYPFIRTTIYVLLSDCGSEMTPKSVVLKGTYKNGPLRQEIPITNLPQKSTTIHQLAVRKEIKELEEGRGWVTNAKDASGKLLKDEYEEIFSDIVQREAVRLGVKFQVSGKWCSFVAVEKSSNELDDPVDRLAFVSNSDDIRDLAGSSRPKSSGPGFAMGAFGATGGRVFPPGSTSAERFSMSVVSTSQRFAQPMASFSRPGGDFSHAASMARPPRSLRPSSRSTRRGRGNDDRVMPLTAGLEIKPLDITDNGWKPHSVPAATMKPSHAVPTPAIPKATTLDTAPDVSQQLQNVVALQRFAGNWVWNAKLEMILGVTSDVALKLSLPEAVLNSARKDDILATVCAVVFIKTKLDVEKEAWEILVQKATDWLEEQIGRDVEELEKVIRSVA